MLLSAPEGSSKLMTRLGRDMLSGKSLDANSAGPLTGTVLTAPFWGTRNYSRAVSASATAIALVRERYGGPIHVTVAPASRRGQVTDSGRQHVERDEAGKKGNGHSATATIFGPSNFVPIRYASRKTKNANMLKACGRAVPAPSYDRHSTFGSCTTVGRGRAGRAAPSLSPAVASRRARQT